MQSNIRLNHKLLVYDVQASEFGDTLAAGTVNELAALVEDTQGFQHGGFADENSGSITAYISPADPYYVSKNGRLFGLVAQFSRTNEHTAYDWYQITSVRPGESLLSQEPDLVELTLNKIVKRESVEV